MKRKFLPIAIVGCLLCAVSVMAQDYFYAYYKDGSTKRFPTLGVDSISFIAPEETLSVSPSSVQMPVAGGSFNLEIFSNTFWTITSNQTWIVPELNAGSDNASVKIEVEPNTSSVVDQGVVTISTQTGKFANIIVERDKVRVIYGPDLKDCQNNVYTTVWIGTQLWMAEDLRCTQYDTESEMGTSSISTSDYTDARTKDKCSGGSYYRMKDEDIANFGLLYPWWIAVGFSSKDDAIEQVTEFGENRQGLCPNGWHIPSADEVNILVDYIEVVDGWGERSAAKHLSKAFEELPASSWEALNTYGFSAEPSGSGGGTVRYNAGTEYHMWTSSPVIDGSISGYRGKSYSYRISYGRTLVQDKSQKDTSRFSIRCVKN